VGRTESVAAETCPIGSPISAADGPRRLHWGCGEVRPAGWLNADIHGGPGVALEGDIRDGLPLQSDSVDYVVSIHALQDLPFLDVAPALRELRRVLRPGSVLRLGLPDLDRAIAAYQRGDRHYFYVPDSDAECIGGKLAAQMTWFGSSRMLFTWESTEEWLRRAGFGQVARCAFGETRSRYPEIVELDSRERESLFAEAVK
jgi:predicted SAM-dependent methyltransferase